MRPTLPVLAWLTVGGLAVASPAPGQAALTPADSAILNSQPLKRLVLAPSLLRRLNLLAAGLDREVVLCLQGTVAGDTALVREFAMPDIVHSSVDAVTPVPCPPATTLAVWHNHPWVGPDSSFGMKTPEDLCSLSQPDLRTVVARFPRQWLELPTLGEPRRAPSRDPTSLRRLHDDLAPGAQAGESGPATRPQPLRDAVRA